MNCSDVVELMEPFSSLASLQPNVDEIHFQSNYVEAMLRDTADSLMELHYVGFRW